MELDVLLTQYTVHHGLEGDNDDLDGKAIGIAIKEWLGNTINRDSLFVDVEGSLGDLTKFSTDASEIRYVDVVIGKRTTKRKRTNKVYTVGWVYVQIEVVSGKYKKTSN